MRVGETRRVTAKFVGEDGSLGYRKGQTYELALFGTHQHPVVIRRAGGGGYCPYSPEETFTRNWEVLEEKKTL